MRRLRSLRVLVVALTLLPVVAVGAVLKAGSSHAASPGLIVFASDRAKADPGEIYSLAPGTAPRDVSRSLAGDYGLAVSPVGDRIAFWSGRSGDDHIYLARADGSHLRRVRPSGADFAQNSGGGPLVFSADGRRLFASLAPEALVIETRTATARELPFCQAGALAPSPDGKLVACGVRGRTIVYDLAGKARFSFPGQRPMWSSRGWLTNQPGQGFTPPLASALVFDASGRRVGRVQGQPAGWSRDGRYLLFGRGQSLRISDSRSLGRSRLLLAKWGGALSFTPDNRFVSTGDFNGHALLVPLAGGRALPGLDFGGGAWSREGRLAYADYRGQFPTHPGGKIGVYITDAHGRNPRIAGSFPFDDHAFGELRWLPGGRRVLFTTSNSCGGSGLFAVSAAGGTARPLNDDLRDLEMPSWSPDGTRIAYSTQLFDCHLGAGLPIHLETMGADGAGVRVVTDEGDIQEGSFDVEPAFGPDGRIAFLHQTTLGVALETVAAAGGARKPVVNRKGYRDTPVWSADGSKIAFASGGGIWAVAASGGTAERIAMIPRWNSGSCGGRGLAWSPDGKQFAAGGADGVYVITLGKPAPAKPAIRVPCAEYPSFSPDGKQVAFDAPPANPLGYQTAIMVANTDGTNVRTLSTAPFRQSVHPSWQPAG